MFIIYMHRAGIHSVHDCKISPDAIYVCTYSRRHKKVSFRLRCTENGTKNGEKMVMKTVSERLVKRCFSGAKTVNEKQKLHKFCATASAVQV